MQNYETLLNNDPEIRLTVVELLRNLMDDYRRARNAGSYQTHDETDNYPALKQFDNRNLNAN